MKTSTIAPAVITCLLSVISSSAVPIPVSDALTTRDAASAIVDALFVRDIEADILTRAAELEARAQTGTATGAAKSPFRIGTVVFRDFASDDMELEARTTTGVINKTPPLPKFPISLYNQHRDVSDDMELEARKNTGVINKMSPPPKGMSGSNTVGTQLTGWHPRIGVPMRLMRDLASDNAELEARRYLGSGNGLHPTVGINKTPVFNGINTRPRIHTVRGLSSDSTEFES